MGTVRELRDFLEDAELGHYHSAIANELKITTIPQLKYVEEEDLFGIGMTKPEMRRMKKLYKREFPQGALGKLKKAILTRSGSDVTDRRGLSPSPPENRNRPPSYIRPPGKQIIPADAITSNKTLGEGEFGIVQQGIWTTETGEQVQVAIKCLSRERLQNGTTEFLKEAGIMQTIDHENIVRMFGVVLDKDDSLALVTELAPMRSLLECLKEPSLRFDFTIPRLCDFAQEICDGMSYLESKRLIHRDLAARNILVFSKSKVKISDFGLSRALGVGKDYYQSNFSINLKLPIAWCAPECINYLKFTSASDVWAFGVILWELFTYGFQPWAGLTGQQILEAIDSPSDQRLERPDLCTKEFYSLMLKCWDKEPQNRPTFSEMFVILPQLRPSQVKTVKDFPEITVPKDFLYYKSYDLITVIDKNPENAHKPGLWKGVLSNGKSGLFDPINCVPFQDHKTSPGSKANIVRKDSKRNSGRKIRADMISGPQNDLRHTGHIGYDGAVFGDISFIGDNYDKLPVKVGSGKLGDQASTSSTSLTRQSPDKDSHHDYPINGGPTTNGLSHSWISQESIDSHCVVRDDVDGWDRTPQYQDIDDDSIFADFKMPDMSGSFDFGPSFMDEVLKALDEKEAKLQSASSSSDASTPSKEETELVKNNHDDRGGSLSPPVYREARPPLPTQPPRSEMRRDPPKPELRKQAKVKPMSASDEKMIDNAIALANEVAVYTNKNNRIQDSPPTSPTTADKRRSDSESGSESPKLMTKLKMSIKRSPKQERKRTFSEEIANKAEREEEVPPEAQEAYNLLVVRGSLKEKNQNQDRDFSYERKSTPEKDFSYDRRNTPERNVSFERKNTDFSYGRRNTPERNVSFERKTTPEQSFSYERKKYPEPSYERKVTPTESRVGVPLANTEEVFIDTYNTAQSKPVPKPRMEIKRSEIPVPMPKPRPEIIHRVEPVVRPQYPPPQVPSESDDGFFKFADKEDSPKLIEDHNTSFESDSDLDDSKKHIEVLRIDLPDSDELKKDSATDSPRSSFSQDSSKSDRSLKDSTNTSTKSSSLFDDEFAEPSPREIMSKLARESRIRRSLDHQRGVLGGGDSFDAAPNRNIREPQGIPGKSLSTSNDDDEVDTNPLRMLRGGAIPIRGGRVGQGMNSRPLKLRTKIPTFHHSMSVDSGTSRVNEHAIEGITNDHHDDIPTTAPAVPPRSYSTSEDNPIPLPPRNPHRAGTLNTKPRERKHPLVLDENPGRISSNTAINSAATNVAWSSPKVDEHEQCPDLPPAPPTPIKTSMPSWNYPEDDNVFEGPVIPEPKRPDCFPNNQLLNGNTNKSSTFPRNKYPLGNVKCNLEQLGFYNSQDPFWVKTLTLAGRNVSDGGSSEEISPLMLANYKSSDGVSYEDLLDFALDREKNCSEIEAMQLVFSKDISVAECMKALEDTKWDVSKAIKYVKLKQLLSTQLADIHVCKEALMKTDWDVERAANYLLSHPLTSPECVDV